MYDQQLLDVLGLRYVLLEQIGPNPVKGSASNEHRVWLQRGDTAHVYSSLTHPDEYARACADIAAEGELVSISKYLRNHFRAVQAVTNEYRASIRVP